jgi:hypothetical protein
MSARRVSRRKKDIKTGFWMAAASKIFYLLLNLKYIRHWFSHWGEAAPTSPRGPTVKNITIH